MADLRSTGNLRALIEVMLWSGFLILVLAIGASKTRSWFAEAHTAVPQANPWVNLQPRAPRP